MEADIILRKVDKAPTEDAQTEASVSAQNKKLSSVSVVFPAYNEETNIEMTVLKAIGAFKRHFETVEIIVVNDGSSDGTRDILERLRQEHEEVRPIHHVQNKGYGGAVRTGLKSGRGDFIFFSDSDGQFDLEEVDLLLRHINEYDIVVGYRAQRADPWHRKLNAYCWGTLVRYLFGIRVRDIDCAFKIFRRDFIQSIRIEAEGAMINTEILAQAGMMHCTIKQVPVSHYPRLSGSATGANPLVIFKAFVELFNLYGKLKATGYKELQTKA
ncbi:glycosyltransferase family 2 protein [Hahella sp. NBU794]|uniref:glycosyltransferase family 2 protein n=1 Tax=Hahella sp. NBU794 TaxID=3422590 RepID=UPI003D6F3AEC